MYCIYCGKDNPDGNSFCMYCGQKMEMEEQPQEKDVYCIYCGKKNPAGNSFCMYCGQEMETEGAGEENTGQAYYTGGQNPASAGRAAYDAWEENARQTDFARKTDYTGGGNWSPDGSAAYAEPKELRFPTAILIAMIVIAAALGVFLYIQGVMAKSDFINLNDYVSVSVTGCDGYAKYDCTLDKDALNLDWGGKVEFTNQAQEELSSDIIEKGAIEYMCGAISVEAASGDSSTGSSEYAGLSNGDKIKYVIHVDDSLAKYIKCDLGYDDNEGYGTGTLTVEGLNTAEAFDAFDGLSVSFSGSNGKGECNISYNGTQLDTSDFVCDNYSRLSNGDVVTVSLAQQDEGYYIAGSGQYPLSYQKTYTVSGLGAASSASSDTSEDSSISAKAGDIITFGTYEQDNDSGNGQEDIEWIVLDVEDGMALLLSRYCLDCQPYNNRDKEVTWEDSSLREWLNGTFMESAFSETEQKQIALSGIENDDDGGYGTNAGSDTQDKVFLLSIDETTKYLTKKKNMIATATDYAKEKMVEKLIIRYKEKGYDYTDSQVRETYLAQVEENGGWAWWLRSPGIDNYNAVRVNVDGDILGGGEVDDYIDGVIYDGVRPAIWVDLS